VSRRAAGHGAKAGDGARPDGSERPDIARAVELLRAGGVVAIPTDTVYGIAASLEYPQAVERLFTIKGRAGTKAIPVLVSDRAQLERFAASLSESARLLADEFWPGGLTIVVRAADGVPESVLRGGDTVGLRMPACRDALEVIAGAGGALAVTSANRSGDREARSADEVRAKLGERVDFIVDGGRTPDDRPSTVVEISGERARILRAGAIDAARLLAVLERNA
jgi:L-threonylcarbamoyladenylate synthase